MNDIEKQNSDINIQEETTTDIVKETNNNIVDSYEYEAIEQK